MSIGFYADPIGTSGYFQVNNANVATFTNTGTVAAATLSGDLAWSIKTAAYTAGFGERISADTTGGAWTLKLPSNPYTGATVTIADNAYYWGTNSLTVSASKPIEALTQTLNCNVNGAMFVMFYNGSTWRVIH